MPVCDLVIIWFLVHIFNYLIKIVTILPSILSSVLFIHFKHSILQSMQLSVENQMWFIPKYIDSGCTTLAVNSSKLHIFLHYLLFHSQCVHMAKQTQVSVCRHFNCTMFILHSISHPNLAYFHVKRSTIDYFALYVLNSQHKNDKAFVNYNVYCF